jgi:hypothetical protein
MFIDALNTKKRFLTFALTIEERCLEGVSWERHFVEFFICYLLRTTYMCDRSFVHVIALS